MKNLPTIDYLVRPFAPDHFEEIASLIQQSLDTPGIPRTREFWLWKHVLNPFGVSPAIVAEHNQRIIGLRIFMNWRWNIAGKVVKAVRAVDTVTHPDWRGKGVFSGLSSTLLEHVRALGVSFVFNTPNKSSKPGYLKMGWQEITRIPLLVRPLRPIRAAMRLFGGVKSGWEPDQSTALPAFNNLSCLEQIAESHSNEKRIHTNRTLAYLRWRYAQIPGISYYVKRKSKDDGFALMIFRQRIRKGLCELSISELFLSDTKNGILLGQELVEETARESSGDYMVAIAAADSPEREVLKQAGFFTLQRIGPSLTVRPLEKTVKDLNILDWQRWRCSIGDLEVF